ncbi:hypothetical protein RHECNPAF_6420096 [Rhizobium etli CNPAF512]|nr:hypothetical protein RHECNPAF_6420096 [Rhizobium etli CNPAF512]
MAVQTGPASNRLPDWKPAPIDKGMDW